MLVDPGQIQRAILDLATHARDAMPDGGTMIVETRRVVLTEAYVAQHINVQPGVYVLLAISDTGSGMDSEMQLHLFEPFYSRATVARAPVSGCPRSTASSGRAADTSGSTASPATGRRSRFICPRRRRQSRASAPASRKRSPSLPRGRASVLLVEDEPGVRAVAHKVLEACGYKVVTASSGEEALERCLDRGLEPDLLITDVVMPGITGSQLVAHLRTHRDGFVCCTPRVSPKMRSSITAWPVASTFCRSPSRLPISRIKYEKSSVERTRPSRRDAFSREGPP